MARRLARPADRASKTESSSTVDNTAPSGKAARSQMCHNEMYVYVAVVEQ